MADLPTALRAADLDGLGSGEAAFAAAGRVVAFGGAATFGDAALLDADLLAAALLKAGLLGVALTDLAGADLVDAGFAAAVLPVTAFGVVDLAAAGLPEICLAAVALAGAAWLGAFLAAPTFAAGDVDCVFAETPLPAPLDLVLVAAAFLVAVFDSVRLASTFGVSAVTVFRATVRVAGSVFAAEGGACFALLAVGFTMTCLGKVDLRRSAK